MNTNEEPAADKQNAEPETSAPETQPKRRVWLKRIAIAAGTLFVLVLIFIAFGLGPVAKWTLNSMGADILGVDKVSVETIVVRPFTGYVRVENLVVGKPVSETNSFSQNLVELEYFEVDVAVFSVLSQKKVIESLTLKNLSANYEQLLNGTTNVGTLAERFTSRNLDVPEEKNAVPATESDEEIFIAAEFVEIDGIRVSLNFAGIPSPLPPISIAFREGLGVNEDLTPLQFATRFAGNSMNVFKVFQGSTISDAASATTDAVIDAGKAVFSIFSGSEDEPKK